MKDGKRKQLDRQSFSSDGEYVENGEGDSQNKDLETRTIRKKGTPRAKRLPIKRKNKRKPASAYLNESWVESILSNHPLVAGDNFSRHHIGLPENLPEFRSFIMSLDIPSSLSQERPTLARNDLHEYYSMHVINVDDLVEKRWLVWKKVQKCTTDDFRVLISNENIFWSWISEKITAFGFISFGKDFITLEDMSKRSSSIQDSPGASADLSEMLFFASNYSSISASLENPRKAKLWLFNPSMMNNPCNQSVSLQNFIDMLMVIDPPIYVI